MLGSRKAHRASPHVTGLSISKSAAFLLKSMTFAKQQYALAM
jgi:hypothetical protein